MLLERFSRPVRGVRIIMKESSPLGAQIVPHRRLETREVRQLIDHLTRRVEGPIVTSAMTTVEQDGFRSAGFVEREALHLLRHPLHEVPEHVETVATRSGRWTDTSRVLEIDAESFDHFWKLDRDGLLAARKATPIHRYRVALIDRRVVGYAISGRSGRSAFLQRLGVDPVHRGQGIGAQLVSDSIRWAIAGGGASMLVNTQVVNDDALRLYERLGFVLDREQLKVLEWPR